MTVPRRLIVNADDFGLSAGINRGISKAHLHGIVTSASLMVRGPAAKEAAAFSRAHPSLSTGIHVDLGEWVFRNGEWQLLYEVVSLSDAAAVEDEVGRQMRTFRQLVGRSPTHLDSHQHVHQREPALSVLRRWAAELEVPLRHYDPRITHCGRFYGQTAEGDPLHQLITVEGLLRLFDELGPGTTEIACHPAEGHDFDSSYAAERSIETAVLCDPRVRAGLAARSIALVSFEKLATPAPSK